MMRTKPGSQPASSPIANRPIASTPIHAIQPTRLPESLLARLLTVLGLSTLVAATLIVPAVLDQRVQRVIGFRASDLSSSGMAYPTIVQQHCQAQLQQLKQGDWMITIDYADRPEITQDKPVLNKTSLLKQCQKNSDSLFPADLGHSPGTSLGLLLDQILVVIHSKRAQGITAPVVVTIWVQAAEPVPGQPAFNIAQIKSQIQQITDNRGVITLMGAAGQLQTVLRSALADNPHTRVCTLNDISECVSWAYKTGRQLPSS